MASPVWARVMRSDSVGRIPGGGQGEDLPDISVHLADDFR